MRNCGICHIWYREDFYRHAYPSPEDILPLVQVADSTLRFGQGIPEARIVDLARPFVEVYRRPVDGTYLEKHIPERGEIIAPKGWAEFGVAWAELL